MKSEIQSVITMLKKNIPYIEQDLNSIFDNIEEVDDNIKTVEAALDASTNQLGQLGERLDNIESELTDITEGVCYRSRTTSPNLNGSTVTLLWDDSIRMNSNYCTYNVPTAEYRIEKAGWYQLTYKVNLQHNAGANRLTYKTWILLNNNIELERSTTYGWTQNDSQGELITLTISMYQQLSVGDLVEIQNQAARGNSSFGANNADYFIIGPESFFQVKYVDDI